MEDESGLDEPGWPDLPGPGASPPGGPPPGSPWDEEVIAGFDPCDQLDPWEAPDEEGWPAFLPADMRAEVESRPAVAAAAEDSPEGARAAFAWRGSGDEMLPGRFLAGLLAEATLDGYPALSEDELAGVLRGWQRQIAHCQAGLARAVTEITERRLAQAARPGWSAVADHIADELAAELSLTGRAAQRLRDVAAGLRRLPAVQDALLNGTLDWPRACLFADELAVLGDAAAAEAAGRLVGPAAGWTTGQLRAALARAVLAADPAAAGRRKSRARQDARVEVWHEPSGNAVLAGRELAAADVIAAQAQLAADADWAKSHGAAGSLPELRAGAFIARLTGRDLATLLPDTTDEAGETAIEQPPAHQGPGRSADPQRPQGTSREPAPAAGSIHLTMPLSAWLGGGQPGEVAGYGPVDAATSRELAGLLAADPATRWCLTLTGPDGRAAAHACARRGPAAGESAITWAAGLLDRLLVLESGACRHARQAAGYVPPPRLRHLVMVRQRRCSFPGCRCPARRCDLDHTIPFGDGGRSCECNLAPLCRMHHRAKQTPGWQLTQDQPGHMIWRLPSGREYQTTGPPYLG